MKTINFVVWFIGLICVLVILWRRRNHSATKAPRLNYEGEAVEHKSNGKIIRDMIF